ncbi:MAG: DUF1992 domain-containing protein [Chthonomonadaceae bacterium]|nr:DUF1992 domain-containing protein [Chthonomonadaceae bacterium]
MDPDVIGKIAERKIQEAMDEGVFENLPGNGKPIVFDEDPLTPAHLRMANRVLKNAGVLPEWMQVQRELAQDRADLETFRVRALEEHAKRFPRPKSLPETHSEVTAFHEWHSLIRTGFLKRVKNVNTGVLKLSLVAPFSIPSQSSFKIEETMRQFDLQFPALPISSKATTSTEKSEVTLKQIARERYGTGQGGAIGGWLKAVRMTAREQIAASDDFQSEEK